MSVISAFQRLPLHIAEAVIKYYILPFQKYPKNPWLTLYSISYSWRTLALQHFYQKVSIVAAAAIDEDKLKFSLMPSLLKTDTALLSYVKEVDISFQHDNGNLGEKQPNDFSNTWPESLVFPKARSLKINVAGFLQHYATATETPATTVFLWLVQRIITSMPKLQKATVIDDRYREDFNQGSLSRVCWNAGNLLSAIFERATIVSINTRGLRPENIYPCMLNCSKLVELEFLCEDKAELLHHIARKSADTLKTLQISAYPSTTIKSLVIDDEDQPVVFPRLQKLHFYSSPKNNYPERTFKIDESVVIFPALRHLTWEPANTFEDDILFKGNSDTLVYLDITFRDALINILEKRSVFFAGIYPRLSHVKVRDAQNSIRNSSENELYLKHTARLLSPVTQFLSILYECSYQEIDDVVFKTSNLQNIRVLNIACIEITFFEMLDLLKKLPTLTTLRASTLSMYQDLEHGLGRTNEFVENAYKEYYPLSFHFKLWMQASRGKGSMISVALASVVLAVLCPRFAYTRVPSLASRETYQRELKDMIANFANSQHFETLVHFYKRAVEYFG